MRNYSYHISMSIAFLFLIILGSCNQRKEVALSQMLPILGEIAIHPKTKDTIFYKAPKFKLVNQENKAIEHTDFSNKIQVVDFFFTSCPTICPVMTNNLAEVQTYFEDEEKLRIISFSIDSKNDTPEILKEYAAMHEVPTNKWSLLTGDQKQILQLAKDYKVRAFTEKSMEDESDNLLHDGTFVLIDTQRRIRGYYDGLDANDTNRLINDINVLLIESK
ncbi:SCO family protein [uncultured Aquimarina sp.]|uniref:SCO family protein n=1 Tax=uncultured Aquimarina sp. TaxID=575652 RepID=UPI0026188F5F|nr:SCO family protein [uncultured Aquimarina sp.]